MQVVGEVCRIRPRDFDEFFFSEVNITCIMGKQEGRRKEKRKERRDRQTERERERSYSRSGKLTVES